MSNIEGGRYLTSYLTSKYNSELLICLILEIFAKRILSLLTFLKMKRGNSLKTYVKRREWLWRRREAVFFVVKYFHGRRAIKSKSHSWVHCIPKVEVLATKGLQIHVGGIPQRTFSSYFNIKSPYLGNPSFKNGNRTCFDCRTRIASKHISRITADDLDDFYVLRKTTQTSERGHQRKSKERTWQTL